MLTGRCFWIKLIGLLCGPLFRGARSIITTVSPDLLPPKVYTLELRIALWPVLLSLFISLGLGLLFGLYPASLAANMNPIDDYDMSRFPCISFKHSVSGRRGRASDLTK